MALHVETVVFLGTSSFGSLLGNALQIFASFLATAMCFRAARRGVGFARSFWTLVGFGMGVWGLADFGWTYYEIFLHMEPPPGSLIRFLFDTHGMFFVMAIFLNQDKEDSRIDVAEMLDFLQIGILFFLVYFGAYYLPAINLGYREALAREFQVMTVGTAGIFLLALLQWRRSATREVRRLFGGLASYILVYGILATIVSRLQVENEMPTGTWFDLGWTTPLLLGAFWAATWRPAPESETRAKRRNHTLAEILVNNGMFFFAPMVILIQVAQLGPGLRGVRFTLLGVSFSCYAVRIGLTQYRQQQDEETVRRQSLAMDSSIEGIGILDEKGVHSYANSALALMLGFDSPLRIVGQPWKVVYAFQPIAEIETQVRKGLKETGKWAGNLQLRRPDGSRIPVEFHVGRMPDGGTVCVCRDLSQHQEAEKARADAETKYRMLVEHVNAITYIAEIGINGKWYYISPQVENILGYTPEEWLAISSNWDQHIHPDDLPIVIAAEEQSLNGFPFQAEFRVRRKDGREVWLSDTAVIVQGSDSHPVMEGIMVDITERKALETQLQQSRKMEAVGRLAGGIAHDFNNLLTIISGYTEMALSRPQLPSEAHADIERIENASARAAALVRQLLAFSRKQVLQPKILDLNKIVLNLDSLLRRLMDERIEMVTRVKDDLGKVKADPAQVEQVIMNLVVNARDAMPEGGRLVVETCNTDLDANYAVDHVSVRPGRYVMLAVSDTGVGMDRQTVAHIFEPFFTTKESGRGTGLGLSTVYGIVKQSGGYIWVYSEPGKGSTFKVYLPRVDEVAEAVGAAQIAPRAQRGTETILIVEDEEVVRELIQTVLAEKGYDVIASRDPQHAEEIAARFAGEIHLLLTDMVMPGTSGRELAERISAKRRGIRVLFMSGYTDNVITSGGMLEEGLAFLQKPFSPAALVQKVREVLSQTPAV
ncbi:MAG TPA: PAS domain S-box protein [Candidatus Acidoferrum sp.]|jgi:PAS domain S-box-containing protein|nr:PAS domain S-box protein [Candidatus Acidoferrum sp.]